MARLKHIPEENNLFVRKKVEEALQSQRYSWGSVPPINSYNEVCPLYNEICTLYDQTEEERVNQNKEHHKRKLAAKIISNRVA